MLFRSGEKRCESGMCRGPLSPTPGQRESPRVSRSPHCIFLGVLATRNFYEKLGNFPGHDQHQKFCRPRTKAEMFTAPDENSAFGENMLGCPALLALLSATTLNKLRLRMYAGYAVHNTKPKNLPNVNSCSNSSSPRYGGGSPDSGFAILLSNLVMEPEARSFRFSRFASASPCRTAATWACRNFL